MLLCACLKWSSCSLHMKRPSLCSCFHSVCNRAFSTSPSTVTESETVACYVLISVSVCRTFCVCVCVSYCVSFFLACPSGQQAVGDTCEPWVCTFSKSKFQVCEVSEHYCVCGTWWNFTDIPCVDAALNSIKMLQDSHEKLISFCLTALFSFQMCIWIRWLQLQWLWVATLFQQHKLCSSSRNKYALT